jgi:hypothetical protein
MSQTDVINVGIVLFLIFAWTWDLPEERASRRLISQVRPVILFSGLWHSWRLFAPNPESSNIKLRALVRLADDTIVVWDPVAQARNSGRLSFSLARERKWQHNLAIGKSAYLREPLCHYISRDFHARGYVPLQIALVNVSQSIPSPGSSRNTQNQSVLFAYDLEANSAIKPTRVAKEFNTMRLPPAV